MPTGIALFLAVGSLAIDSARAGLTDVIARVEPAIVAVGSHHPLGQPSARYRGTGFAVGDGRLVLTNSHVLPGPADLSEKASLAVFVGRGQNVRGRRAQVVAEDAEHDLAVLRIKGEPLPSLSLGSSEGVRPGTGVAFTGFPIGMVLGMYPVTHRGMVSSITPIAIPRGEAKSLDSRTIKRLEDPFPVFQLDATAYPGNSGSPLFRQDNGKVIGIVNMVFVKDSKESLLKDPSRIAYAIPVRHAQSLLEQARKK